MSDLRKTLKTTAKYISLLGDSGIKNERDLLQYFPRNYEERSAIKTLKEINREEKETCMVKGRIESKKMFPRGNKKIFEITFKDTNGSTGYISIFNSPYTVKKIESKKRFIIIGKPNFQYGKIIFSHPDVIETNPNEKAPKSYNLGRIFPIYPELNGIKANWFAQKMRLIIDQIPKLFKEYFPEEFLKKYNLMGLNETIKNSHYPSSIEKQQAASGRIFFDKLLRIQLFSLINKKSYQEGIHFESSKEIQRDVIKDFLSKLSFELTNAQKKSLKSIIENLHEEKPMLRLLQGDVGSGKTIVAAASAYYTHKVLGGQSVFLAPLEILATQHYKNLAKLFLPLGIHIEILKGSLTATQKKKVKKDIEEGKINILVGTHAILQNDVKFHNLKYAVIDEQHKFGVKQRAFFRNFGSPHILQMSATPIPRSMALAFFGEFDVSIIDEMPAGRKSIHTKIISYAEFSKIQPRILSKINKKQKVFIVTPLIEESEKIENVQSAISTYNEVKNMFGGISDKIGLLHGKMKAQEKETTMKDFKEDKLQILVSTTVIEVGVDIPEATIMIIKNAERFGLSQLHQLRGRIGRSSIQSYCFLETKSKSGDSYKRLRAMEKTNDGFKLAELDLQYRGAGEILGVRQSGDTDIPINILSDLDFLDRIQGAAGRLMDEYPNLEELPQIKNYLNNNIGDVMA